LEKLNSSKQEDFKKAGKTWNCRIYMNQCFKLGAKIFELYYDC